MPRRKSVSDETLIERAAQLFWANGSSASIDEITQATGANRSAIYARFGDKTGLFRSSLQHYSDTFVTENFGPVASENATFDSVEQYFARVLSKDVPGCFMTNTMTEASHLDDETIALTQAHFERMQQGFAHAISAAFTEAGHADKVTDTSRMLAVFAQGLFAVARITTDPKVLTASYETVIAQMRSLLDVSPSPPKRASKK